MVGVDKYKLSAKIFGQAIIEIFVTLVSVAFPAAMWKTVMMLASTA
jgi:hypothetical protein